MPMRHDGRGTLDERECTALFRRLFPRGFAGEDVRAELAGVPVAGDLGEAIGLCLWDTFSENHEVVSADGRIADLGSWRASADFIADRLNEQVGSSRYGYMDFYMGSLGWRRSDEGRTALASIYGLIFRRLKAEGCDWEYSFPRLYVVDLSPLAEELARGGDAEWSGYDPSAAVAGELEAAGKAEERARMKEELEEAHREAVEEARRGPPPETVEAYRKVYGRFPRGWPPE